MLTNCLLTTLAKGKTEAISIDSGSAVPGLAPLATDPEELAWVKTLPFTYEALDAEKIIELLLKFAAQGKASPFQKEWIITTKVVRKNAEPLIQTFVIRRERKWLRTIIHIGKL